MTHERPTWIPYKGGRVSLQQMDLAYLREKAEWKRRLVAAHPDRKRRTSRGTTGSTFAKLSNARDRWKREWTRRFKNCGYLPPDMVVEVETPVRRGPLLLSPPALCEYCKEPRTQKRRGRFCGRSCSTRWQREHCPDRFKLWSRRGAEMNIQKANKRIAGGFRHIEDVDARVRAAFHAGYQAGYHAAKTRRRAAA